MKSKTTNRFLLLFFATVMIVSCVDSVNHNEPPYEGPPKGNIISVERAQEMYNNYSQRRVPIIQEYEDSIVPSKEKFTPTRYVEYDLKTIKQYIAFIEHEAKQAEVDINTLRFYLTNYPNSDKFPNGDAVKYPRRNTFFIIPTADFDGENVGFSVEEIDGKYIAVPVNKRRDSNDKGQSEPEGQVNEAGFFIANSAAVGGSTSLILNDGTAIPPPGTNPFSVDN